MFNVVKVETENMYSEKIKASIDVQYHSVVLRDVRIIEGKTGLFAAPPSKRLTDGTFLPYFEFNKEDRDKLTEACVNAYNTFLGNKGRQTSSPAAPPRRLSKSPSSDPNF